jgi:hypothetical protein
MMKKPLKLRTSGATPIEKWINLVNKWNTCTDDYNNPYSIQRMLFTKAEVNDLVIQYPLLADDLRFYNSLTPEQMDFVVYSEYKFNFDIPSNMPRPAVIAGYKLLD